MAEEQKVPNGSATKQPALTSKPAASIPTATTDGKPELSNAEKKKLAKAEKVARRAKEKEPAASNSGADAGSSQAAAAAEKGAAKGVAGQEQKAGARRASTVKDQRPKQVAADGMAGKSSAQEAGRTTQNLPLRRRPSHSVPAETKQERKQISFFAHLYGQPHKQSLDGVSKEIHPAVLALGLQLSSYTICGSQARCIAMLLVLKSVIRSYTTPAGNSLPRHLASQYLSPQLSHIKSARPFSVTQANAIRWLKNYIANIDPSVAETKAKREICDAIDTFIRERFTVADQIISEAAAARIQDGDVVLTYGKSAVVQQALMAAARKGVQFRVVVVDSRPLFEGKNLAAALASAGIAVTYSTTHSLAYIKKDITLCILGAHAILGNGRLYSRAGTALVAVAAKESRAPVIVCAESIKFTERVALDSIVLNELAPEDELNIMGAELREPKSTPSDAGTQDLLTGWREKENLHLLNVLYDVTPADFIEMVITEYGSLPPMAALAVQRMSAGS